MFNGALHNSGLLQLLLRRRLLLLLLLRRRRLRLLLVLLLLRRRRLRLLLRRRRRRGGGFCRRCCCVRLGPNGARRANRYSLLRRGAPTRTESCGAAGRDRQRGAGRRTRCSEGAERASSGLSGRRAPAVTCRPGAQQRRRACWLVG
jgi:hypothetical protein